MAAGSSGQFAPQDDSVAQLLNEYFDRRQAGEDLTPASFVAEHPELADELRPYLEGLSLIDQARSAVMVERGAALGAAGGEMPIIEGYALRREIGRGGMGVVYEALQVATKRLVAVKVMLAGPFASPAGRQRFEREVELAARLNHAGIVSILESGTVSGQPYYTMSYVEGVRLSRHLDADAPDVPQVLGVFAKLCDAVHFAHTHGVVHRDLKPANVLVDREGSPRILDFGLAKALDQHDGGQSSYLTLSSPGQVMGTLGYLAPEQAAGKPEEIDARSDVYSLGVMLYEALTGRLPIDTSGRPSEVIERILEAPPVLPTRLSPKVDGELETILLKTLAKEKERRYASAEEFGADLRRYLSGEPIRARRSSSLYVARKKLAKYRSRLVIAAAALVVVISGTWSLWQWRAHTLAAEGHREVGRARLELLRMQRGLDLGATDSNLGLIQGLTTRFSELAEAPLVRARAKILMREVDQAIVELERVPETHRGYWASRALLSELYRRGGDVVRADALSAEAELHPPSTADECYLRSLATIDTRTAVQWARETVRRDPQSRLGWTRLVYLHMAREETDDALHAVDKLIQLEPRHTAWQVLKGHVLLRGGRYEPALDVYNAAAETEPRPGIIYPYRAIAYRRLQRYEEAIADYNRILADSSPTVPVWHFYQRATPLWMMGRGEEALADYRRVRVARGRPFFSDARSFLILDELEREEDAARLLAQALQEVDDPWLERVFRTLAGEVRPDDLVAEARQGGKPERICEAYYYAGETCLLAGEQEQARRWFEACVATGVQFDRNTADLAPMNEYELAEWRLRSLTPPPDP